MSDSTNSAGIRDFGAQRRYSAATVERWLALATSDGTALLDLARELRLGEHQLLDLWEWAEEIAARDRHSLAHVLTSERVAAARQSQLGRNDRLKRIKGALRNLRFPQLTALEARLDGLVRDLALPSSVRVALPDGLEGDTLRVEIVADSPAALRIAAEHLSAAAATAMCEEIFALLHEAP